MEKEANHPLLSPSVLPKPTRQHLCKCAHHPQWTAQEKKQRCCWACQALLDPPNQRQRKKACANPWPWAKDSLGLGLTTYKGYKLNVNAKANEKKKQKKKKEKDEGEALPSQVGHEEQPNPATTLQPCNDVVPRPHDDNPWSVGRLDQLADKVARYLRSVTTTDGDHEGGQVGPIDDLLDRVKSAYLRLVACPPGDIRAIAASTDEPDLLVPLVPNSPEGDANAEEELIVAHVATTGPGHEDSILPPPDPRCTSREPTPSDHRSGKRVDADAPSAEGAGGESWIERWTQMDIEELLADPDDDGDFTDRHWKRGAEEHDGDQPTASGAGNQDSYDERDQGEDIRAGEEVHRDSSHEPQSKNQAPGWSAVATSHTQESRQMERLPWARDRDDERRGWDQSSHKRSPHDWPFQHRDRHHHSEANNHHSRRHTHHAPPQNQRSRHNYSHQKWQHNRQTEPTPNATHGRKRSRERTDHFARSPDARQAHHHHPGAGRDKRTRREDKP